MNNIKLTLTNIKCIRAIIMFLSMYLILKYSTIGKIPYLEIIMICSYSIIIQTLLDIYQPIIVIDK